MKALLALLLAVASALAQALPASVHETATGWRQWGSGEMRWLGIALYRATLWVAGQPPSALPANSPSALQLEYRRDISRQRLVQTSVDEMRRLGASEAQLQRWQPELERVLPDVKEGDVIVGVRFPGRGASFHHRGQMTGEIGDDDFARFFFAIWLDPRTRSPALRSALLQPPAE